MRLDVESLSFSIGRRRLFIDCNVSIQGPSTVAIMGPSGSGKSTLLALVATELQPSKGTVSFTTTGEKELPLNTPPRHAWVFQTSPMLSQRTALDNTMIGPIALGVEVDIALRRSLKAMAGLGISHLARKKAFSLSGGEKQRVSVSRAIAAQAPLILADEPTASLDPVARSSVIDALGHAAETGSLVLVATHDQMVADQCDRILRIGDGSLHFEA